jgi:ankyrin repeat protein
MVVGLFLQVGVGFANNKLEQEGQAILRRLNAPSKPNSNDDWEPSGPTVEDILSATKVENLAAKGSLEDKLLSAVKNGDLKNVETFIAAGAGLEARDNDDMTALMRAAEKGYSDIVRILIDAGADISAHDKFRCTAFFKAADKKHVDIVKMLIAKGAATDRNFKDVFVSAAFQGNTEMVKALMFENPEIKYDTLETAYMMVNSRRNPELFNVIVEALNKKSQ